MCRSRQSAEDLVHDTFVALLREPRLFDPAQGTVFGYLCGVLRHRSAAISGNERRWVALSTDDDTSTAPADERPDPPTRSRAQRSRPPSGARCSNCRCITAKIIALCDLEELPYATVAQILHCPIGTVRSRLHRARALLTIRLASLEMIELTGRAGARAG